MYVYVCKCMNVFMYVCIYIHTYICVCKCIYMHVSMCVYMRRAGRTSVQVAQARRTETKASSLASISALSPVSTHGGVRSSEHHPSPPPSPPPPLSGAAYMVAAVGSDSSVDARAPDWHRLCKTVRKLPAPARRIHQQRAYVCVCVCNCVIYIHIEMCNMCTHELV
jgi:hypothetical protein